MRLDSNVVWLRVRVQEDAVCNFSFSVDGKRFAPIGPLFRARQGKWIGAKVGIYAIGPRDSSEMGYADYDWFRIE